MPKLLIKTGVKPKSLTIAAAVINTVTEGGFGFDPVITSGNDSKHMAGSKHYTHNALDIRTSNIPPASREGFKAALKQRLGTDYDLIDEGDHIHLEYDPKA